MQLYLDHMNHSIYTFYKKNVQIQSRIDPFYYPMPFQSGQIIIIDILAPSTNELEHYPHNNPTNVHVEVHNCPLWVGGITHT